ncbi:MAG: Bax inhibitor-1/YccA family protein [Flavobacteriales bacterium]|nr:Bax inhibitor-1/YccA family protein [Flavobacteriales bacterium]
MDNNLFNNQVQSESADFSGSQTLAKTFLSNVFTYMAAALTITGAMAYWFGTDMNLVSMLFTETANGMIKMNGLGYLVMFAPLGFVMLMSFGFQRLSSMSLLFLFLIYSVLMGISLSTIFLRYTGESIFMTFFITSGTFAVMAVLGYTTKTDLTKFGSILIMALIGIILASIINIFLGSGLLETGISILGVLIFTGLTAYDVQKLKRIGSGMEYGNEVTSKLAILGALNLYLDFINLFLFLLRFMGDRK